MHERLFEVFLDDVSEADEPELKRLHRSGHRVHLVTLCLEHPWIRKRSKEPSGLAKFFDSVTICTDRYRAKIQQISSNTGRRCILLARLACELKTDDILDLQVVPIGPEQPTATLADAVTAILQPAAP